MAASSLRRSWFTRRAFCSVGILALVTPAKGWDRPGVGVAQPTNYVSPSGGYALFIDPADRYGRRAATYRLSKNGAEVWSGEKPYTLREVVVTDEGISAGFAYRSGPKDTGASRRRLRGGRTSEPPSYLHIVILDSQGKEMLNDTTERVRRGIPMHPAQPNVRHFLADPPNDRLIVHVIARGPDWWVYRLSTGESLDRFKLKERMTYRWNLNRVLDARILQGSPLVLVHRCLWGPQVRGALFVLLDENLQPIWSLVAKNDYNDIEWWRTGLVGHFRNHPAILRVDQPGRFDLRLFSENKRVSYAIKRDDAGGYCVSEVGRIDFVEPESPGGSTE